MVGASSLVVALFLGTTQLYQLAYALLGLLVASLGLGLAGSRSLGLERRMPHEEGVEAGDSTTIGLLLTNGSRLAAAGMEVVDRVPDRRVSRPDVAPAGGERLVERTVSFGRRGLYGIGPAEIVSTDPLGLLRFRRVVGLESEILAYPETRRFGELAAGGFEESGGRATPTSRGEELSGLREYRPGDDWRFIHWKSVARTGEVVVKEFDPDVPQRYSVVLDLADYGASIGPGVGEKPEDEELEDAVRAAASTVSRLEEAGLSYRLLLTDRTAASTEFGSGGDSYHAALRLLATAEADGRIGTGEALAGEAAGKSLGESVILIQRGAPGLETADTADTQDSSEGFQDAVRGLASRGVSVFVVLLAAHTYASRRPYQGTRDAGSEERVLDLTHKLEASGATVRVLSRDPGSTEPYAGDREKV